MQPNPVFPMIAVAGAEEREYTILVPDIERQRRRANDSNNNRPVVSSSVDFSVPVR